MVEVRLAKAPEGNHSVVFTFESPIGSIDFSLNYEKTEQGITSAIKRFEAAGLVECDAVVDSIKEKLNLSDKWEATHEFTDSRSNA